MKTRGFTVFLLIILIGTSVIASFNRDFADNTMPPDFRAGAVSACIGAMPNIFMVGLVGVDHCYPTWALSIKYGFPQRDAQEFINKINSLLRTLNQF